MLIDDGVANGDAGVVLGAGLADLLLVAAGDDVLLLERDRAGVSVEVPENLDPTRRSGWVRLQNVNVSADDILPGARESALARARTLLAAEAVGGCGRLRRRRRRLCQGAPAIRPHHRDLPGGQAPLREHAGRRRVGDRRRVGRLARRVRGRGAVPADRRGLGRRPGLSRLCAQRRAQHPGARRHRLHLGARRAPAPASGARDAGAVRRRRRRPPTSSIAPLPGRPGRTASTCRPRPRHYAPASVPTPPKSPRSTSRRSCDKLIETGYVMPHWPKPWGRPPTRWSSW